MGLFLKGELLDLTISFITISLAFSMFAIYAGNYNLVPIIFIAVGLSFILHELGHRFMAIRFGCHAYYKMWTTGLLFALGLAIATGGNFIFAAPGAVYIYKSGLTRREDGIISWAGPLVNVFLGIMFAFLALLNPMNQTLVLLAYWGFTVNMFLAMFNLLPFPPLDGSKVAAWSVSTWLITIGFAVLANFVLGFEKFVGILAALL